MKQYTVRCNNCNRKYAIIRTYYELQILKYIPVPYSGNGFLTPWHHCADVFCVVYLVCNNCGTVILERMPYDWEDILEELKELDFKVEEVEI